VTAAAVVISQSKGRDVSDAFDGAARRVSGASAPVDALIPQSR